MPAGQLVPVGCGKALEVQENALSTTPSLPSEYGAGSGHRFLRDVPDALVRADGVGLHTSSSMWSGQGGGILQIKLF